MIKFFRHIRQNLLLEGKTAKYFKYALGEIILVVIGILIALQINTWNESRKERIEERYLLHQLESEFESNLEQLDEKILVRKNMIHASLNLLDFIDDPALSNNDSITKYISQTMFAPTFDPIINDLISSGKLHLISDNRLKQLLSVWTSEIIQVTEEEYNWRNVSQNQYTPFLKEHISIRSIIAYVWQTEYIKNILIEKESSVAFKLEQSKRPEDVSQILEVEDFEDFIAQCASLNNLTNIQSESLRQRILEILKLIRQQLNEFE